MRRCNREFSRTITVAALVACAVVCGLTLVATDVGADPLDGPGSVPAQRVKGSTKRHSQMLMQKELNPISISPTAAASYAQAVGLYRTGDYAKAIDALELALAQDENLRPARTLLVFLLLKTDATARAFALLATGFAHGVLDAQLTLLYARLLLEQHRSMQALAVLRGASAADAAKPAHLALLAGAQQSAGNYRDAAVLYRRLFELQPSQGQWLAGQAVALEAAGDRSAAAVLYAQAMASQISDPTIRSYSQHRLYALRTDHR